MKIEAGKFYRTRDGRKAEVFACREVHGVTFAYGLVGQSHIARTWRRRQCYHDTRNDLVAEWREPAKVTVYLHITYAGGHAEVLPSLSDVSPAGYELFGSAAITEGDGMDDTSGHTDEEHHGR